MNIFEARPKAFALRTGVLIILRCVILSVFFLTELLLSEALAKPAPEAASAGKPQAGKAQIITNCVGSNCATPSPTAKTQEASPWVVLARELDLDFKPEEIFFFVSFFEEREQVAPFTRMRALSVPSSGSPSHAEGARLMAGVRVIVPPRATRVRVGVLVVGRDQRFFLLPPVEEAAAGEALALNTADKLRKAIGERKEFLRTYELQRRAQDQSLQRLREDASVIGNFGRIIEVREEVAQSKRDIVRLERDMANLQKSLKLARAQPLPRNYSRWEVQLTQQLSELALIAKKAEAREFVRKSRSVGSMQRKLAIIEETRHEKLDELQRELQRLHDERIRLEREKS